MAGVVAASGCSLWPRPRAPVAQGILPGVPRLATLHRGGLWFRPREWESPLHRDVLPHLGGAERHVVQGLGQQVYRALALPAMLGREVHRRGVDEQLEPSALPPGQVERDQRCLRALLGTKRHALAFSSLDILHWVL